MAAPYARWQRFDPKNLFEFRRREQISYLLRVGGRKKKKHSRDTRKMSFGPFPFKGSFTSFIAFDVARIKSRGISY